MLALMFAVFYLLFFFKEKTAYEMRISDWSSYVCSSDLRAAVVEDRRRRPQRVVGRWQQHFVAGVEQGAQRQVDQLAHAVADEHPLRRCIRRAAILVEGGDRIARGRQALLVGVGVGVGDAVGDRTLQVPGRAEPERAGVADVELDQGPALRLEFTGPAGQLATDFVSDFGQAFAGLPAGRRHRRSE